MTVPEDLTDRQARAGKNQSLFREVNERIEGLNADFSHLTPDSGDWVCECANEFCVGAVQMSVTEYETVRAKANRFLVMPDEGHVWPEVEHIVERTDRYWIVEKFGAGQVVAEETDPRSSD